MVQARRPAGKIFLAPIPPRATRILQSLLKHIQTRALSEQPVAKRRQERKRSPTRTPLEQLAQGGRGLPPHRALPPPLLQAGLTLRFPTEFVSENVSVP